ncbi:MAG TPA: metallophosphoesterase family protein [Gaiellaceae bacterium]|nr:metallophosphoesterase family protein [Gaiellaceae bacterium]
MRVAVISDVHANLRALEAVLAAIDDEHVDAVWCLGDTVGYGPRPNECCTSVRERAALCLVGNHDLVALGDIAVGDFNDEAAAAALWTRDELSADSQSFLRGLEPAARVEGAELYHASARDPVWEYLLSEDAVRATFDLTTAPLVLVGHSHVALAVNARGDELDGGLAPGGTEVELDGRWVLNPGSTGQPRDGDPRAAWLLLDLEQRRASFRRVAYPVKETQAELRAAGLPPGLAARLAFGE